MVGVFPLWKRNTTALAHEIISLGFKSFLSCVEGKVGPGFVGRAFDQDLLRDLPDDIDPCGEYGEFHTFVYDGPIFKSPVAVSVGEIVARDGRYFADLLPELQNATLEPTPRIESAAISAEGVKRRNDMSQGENR